MKTRQMVDKSFSQHMIYQVFRAITHDIFNDKTWFPTSRCSCEDVFYEVFCIVDKMMFSHTDTESRLAFVEGIGVIRLSAGFIRRIRPKASANPIRRNCVMLTTIRSVIRIMFWEKSSTC